jgi:hypothetical protein
MKTYPLKIEICHSDNERMYRSKGHHSTEDFVEALKEFGVHGKWSVPEQMYLKTTPAPKNSDYSCWYSVVDKSVRGSYPATYVYEYYDKEFIDLGD